jgi:hypothetical protein
MGETKGREKSGVVVAVSFPPFPSSPSSFQTFPVRLPSSRPSLSQPFLTLQRVLNAGSIGRLSKGTSAGGRRQAKA